MTALYDPTATVDREERISLTPDAMRRPSTLGRLYALPPEMEALTDIDEPVDERLERLKASYDEHLGELEEADRREIIEGQVDRMALVLKALNADLKTVEDHFAETKALKEAIEARIASVRPWLQSLMEGEKVEKRKTPLATVWLHPNNPSINVFNDGAVPAEWKRATVVLPLAELPPELVERATVEVQREPLLKHFKEAGTLQPDGRVVNTETGEAVEVPGVEYVTGKKHVRVR